MHSNGFKREKFLVKQKCKEFLAFSSLEVRFLVDSSSCSNNKILTNVIVVPPSNSSRNNKWHTYANNSNNSRGSTRAARVVQLFPSVTAELRGCVYCLVYCQYLTVITVLLVHTLFSHVNGLSDKKKTHPQN